MDNKDFQDWFERNEGSLWDMFINDNQHLPYKIDNNIEEEFLDYVVGVYEDKLREMITC